jgi:hypothetical protein
LVTTDALAIVFRVLMTSNLAFFLLGTILVASIADRITILDGFLVVVFVQNCRLRL